MSLAGFIADQRTDHGVPHAVCCRALRVSQSWFYKWRDRPPTPAERRRAALDAAVRASFEASAGTYGSPRVYADLVAAGWQVSVNTVAASMARHQLVARVRKRRVNLTRPDKNRRPFPDGGGYAGRRRGRGGLSHRPGLDLHRRGVQPAVPASEDYPVDGPGRFMFRQRSSGVVLLFIRA